VGAEEGEHFHLLCNRLSVLGYRYTTQYTTTQRTLFSSIREKELSKMERKIFKQRERGGGDMNFQIW
jgi:hypothetical protein